MAGPALEVEGARQLRAALKRAGVEVADLKAAHRAVADIVAAAARPAAPVRSGRLAGSIRPAGQQGAAVVRAGRASLPYAGVIHWGWPAHHITAQPFLADAAEATRGRWEQTYLSALESLIDSIGDTSP